MEKARRARNANRARGEKLLSSRATGAPLSPGFRPCSLLGSLSPLLKLSNDKNNASEIKTLETKRLVTQRNMYLDQCFATEYQRIDLCLVCFVHVQIPEGEPARVQLWKPGHNWHLAKGQMACLSALQCWSYSC